MIRDRRLAAMRGDIAGSRWPPLFSGKIASLATLLHDLDISQWLDAETIADRQRTQLGRLADHFLRHSPPFAERLAAAGLDADTLARLGGLERLPPLDRRTVQAPTRPIHVETVPTGHTPLLTASTSGSTGEPLTVRRTTVNQIHWLALSLRYHLWAEPDFSGRLAAIRAGHTPTALDQDWGTPASFLFETGPALHIDVRTDIGEQLHRLADFRPTSVILYPSNLAALLDQAEADGIDLAFIDRWRSLGETLPPALIERVGPGRIFDCYSCEEIGYLALQCPSGSGLYHVMAETVIVEIVDDAGRPCPPGESGRVLATDLHNHATPMIRYDLGNHAEAGGPCPCGRGLPTLRRILGRTRNLITRPDGSRHWPWLGDREYRAIAPIRQFQFRQHARDRIEMRLATERPLTEAEETALHAYLRDRLGDGFRFDLTYCDGPLPVGPNGKFEEFVSLL